MEIDSYSGFFDNEHRRATGLGDYLKERGVTDVTIVGLATDYCVKYTALDAQMLGFETTVVADACRGVEVSAGDTARALEEMAAAGVHIVESRRLLDAQQASASPQGA
jgi:nicotinamidase/pyrazinamidase